MERIVLDGSRFTDRETAHAILKEQLRLPGHYGNNLDALWDCLTTDFTDRMILIQQPEMIPDQLGRYGRNMINVLRKVRRTNPHVRVVMYYPL